VKLQMHKAGLNNRNMKQLITLIIILTTQMLYAQQTIFEKNYGGAEVINLANDIDEFQDGGFVIAGNQSTNLNQNGSVNDDIFLIKTNSTGIVS